MFLSLPAARSRASAGYRPERRAGCSIAARATQSASPRCPKSAERSAVSDSNPVAKKVATLGISSVDVEEDPLRVCSMGAEGLEFFLLVGEETGTTLKLDRFSPHNIRQIPVRCPNRQENSKKLTTWS